MASAAGAAPPITLLDLPAHLLEEILDHLADVRALAAATAACRLLWSLHDGCISRMAALFRECPVADTLGLTPIIALAVREAYHFSGRRRRRLEKRNSKGELSSSEKAELSPWHQASYLSMLLTEDLPPEALLAMLQRDGSYVSMFKMQDDGIDALCNRLRLTVEPSGPGVGLGLFAPRRGMKTGGYGQPDGACKLYIGEEVLGLEDPSPNSLWGEEHLDEGEEPLEIIHTVRAVPPGLQVSGRGGQPPLTFRSKTKAGDVMITSEFGEQGGTVMFFMRHVPPAA